MVGAARGWCGQLVAAAVACPLSVVTCCRRCSLGAVRADASPGAEGFGRAAGFGMPMGLVVRRMCALGNQTRKPYIILVDAACRSAPLRVVDVSPLLDGRTGVCDADEEEDGFADLEVALPTVEVGDAEARARKPRNTQAHAAGEI